MPVDGSWRLTVFDNTVLVKILVCQSVVCLCKNILRTLIEIVACLRGLHRCVVFVKLYMCHYVSSRLA